MNRIVFLITFLIHGTCVANDEFTQLTKSIYCPSCQGQVLDESSSPVAIEMKNQIQQMLGSGKSVEEIRQHFTAVYGEKILLKPALGTYTYPLWLAPFLMLGTILFIMLNRMRFLKKRNSVKSTTEGHV